MVFILLLCEQNKETTEPGKEYDVVAVVDDVCTTGGSLIRAAKTLEGIARVSGCFVVIKRGDANSFPYPLEYLFRDTEFLID